MVCGILVPPPGIEPGSSAVKAPSPNHWMAKEFLCRLLFFIYLFLKFIYLFLFLAALGLRCCVWAFSSYGERGLLFVAVHRLLTAVASLVAEHRLQARGLQ